MSASSPIPESVRRDIERIAGPLAQRMLPPKVTASATTRNVAAAVNSDGTLDVAMGGAVMQRVPATTACAPVEVGDEVIVAQHGPRLFAVGTVARSSLAPVPPEFPVDAAAVSLTPNTALGNYSSYVNSSVYIGNGVVLLQCGIILDAATDWNSDELTLFTIGDADMRPKTDRVLQRMCTAYCDNGAHSYSRGITVETSGRVRFRNLSTGTPAVNAVIISGVAYRL